MAFCSPLTLATGAFATTGGRTATTALRTPRLAARRPVPPVVAPSRARWTMTDDLAARFGAGAHDLLVVGAGNLGLRAARQWREAHPDALVMCATWSDERHERLRADGFLPALSSALEKRAPYVLFCAPPSRRQETPQYVADVRRAAALATRRFVFTSATSVYVDAGVVREPSPLAATPRALRMLAAERAALTGRNAAVVRLGLLYDLNRGCHPYWLLYGAAHGGPDSVYNVLHYDDAAGAAVAALRAAPDAGRAFIAVDGRPVTSAEMVRVAQRHPAYAGYATPAWGEGGYKKIVDGSWSYTALDWQPRWPSFEAFFDHEIAKRATEDDLLVSGRD